MGRLSDKSALCQQVTSNVQRENQPGVSGFYVLCGKAFMIFE